MGLGGSLVGDALVDQPGPRLVRPGRGQLLNQSAYVNTCNATGPVLILTLFLYRRLMGKLFLKRSVGKFVAGIFQNYICTVFGKMKLKVFQTNALLLLEKNNIKALACPKTWNYLSSEGVATSTSV